MNFFIKLNFELVKNIHFFLFEGGVIPGNYKLRKTQDIKAVTEMRLAHANPALSSLRICPIPTGASTKMRKPRSKSQLPY